MSWGKNASGTMAVVLAAVMLWPQEVGEQDEGAGATDETKAAHAAQVETVAEIVETAGEAIGENDLVDVTASGHADGTNDQWSLQISVRKQAAPAAG
jgi:hypothetical protein